MPAAPTASRRFAGALLLPVALIGLTSLTACGGGGGVMSMSPAQETGQATAQATALTTADATAEKEAAGLELFDARGWPLAAAVQQVPADTAAHTRSGLYADARQLAWQQQIAGPYTRVFDLDAAGSTDAVLEEARQALARPVDGRTSFFVRAGDLRAGAVLVDALSALGLEDVFLLVDKASAS